MKPSKKLFHEVSISITRTYFHDIWLNLYRENKNPEIALKDKEYFAEKRENG